MGFPEGVQKSDVLCNSTSVSEMYLALMEEDGEAVMFLHRINSSQEQSPTKFSLCEQMSFSLSHGKAHWVREVV